VTLPWEVPEDGRDEDHAKPGWVRNPVARGDRVTSVGGTGSDSPLRPGDEGVIAHFYLDPVQPYVYVDWDRTGIGGVHLAAIRSVDDGVG